MTFEKQEGEPVINGVLALRARSQKIFEARLARHNAPQELVEELENKFNRRVLTGSKGEYPAVTFAFGCTDIKQLPALLQAMADEINDRLKSDSVCRIYRQRLEVEINDRITVRTRIAFVPIDELEACRENQIKGY